MGSPFQTYDAGKPLEEVVRFELKPEGFEKPVM